MNLLHRDLMDAPSLTPCYCVVCGLPTVTRHHVVPRSQGGHAGPVLSLCGHGTAGCHGRAEDKRLHFRYDGRWWWLATQYPVKYQDALELDGWLPCADAMVHDC